MIHKAVFIIIKDPAPAASAVLLLQIIRTLLGVAFLFIEHRNPQLFVFKAGTGAQDAVDLFLRHRKSGGLFALCSGLTYFFF